MGYEGQTAGSGLSSKAGGAVGRSGDGAAHPLETQQQRIARRIRWGQYWSMMAKREARNPRTLRRYEAEQREKHVQQ